jgi:hypothetical protein
MVSYIELSLPSSASSPINTHELNVVRHVERMKNFDINHPLITAYHILITTKVIHPIVSHLPGLLLLVVVAVHIAVDHQLTCTKCGQTG